MLTFLKYIIAYFRKAPAQLPISVVATTVVAQVETQLEAEVKAAHSLMYPARRNVSDIPAVFSNVPQPTLADARNWKEEAMAKARQLRNR